MESHQYTVPDTVAVEPTLLLSFSTRKHASIASRVILSTFFEDQLTQNHPGYLRDCCVHFFRQFFSK